MNLPETTSVAADSEQVPLVFSLKRNDSGRPMLYLNEKPVDEASVRQMFAGEAGQNAERQVSLSADRGIEYGEVMKVVDLLESVGFKRLALDTRHVESR